MIKDDEMIITITTTKIQKNDVDNNMTSIDLGKCEITLKQYYNISFNKILYMKKIDVIQEGMKIPKVVFDIFSKINDTDYLKLNLSLCKSDKVLISVPTIISENIDILNTSSGYYNDICYIAKSDKGADIIIKDRQKEYINNK